MPTVPKAASEYTDYVKKRATVVGRREFSDSLFNSLVLQSSVGRGLGNTPEGPTPSGGNYGVLTGFNDNNKVLWYPSFGDPGDFTVELFFKCSNVTDNQSVWYFTTGANDGVGMYIRNRILYVSAREFSVPLTSITENAWYHAALTRNGSTYYASINGATFLVELGTPNLTNARLCVGDFTPDDFPVYFYSGSISNFRISTPKYSTGTYTIPSVPLSADGAKLLLLAKQDAPFADSAGTYVSEYQCEWAPGPIPSIPQPRPDYGVLTGFATNSVMTYPGFGISGDFTMECFFKSNDPAGANYEPICFFEAVGGSYIGIVLDEGFISTDTSEGEKFPISQIEANTWYHIALTRSGTDFYTSVNGQTSLNSDIIDADISNVDFYVGWYGGDYDYFYSGSISNLRVSNYARYTDNYTLPTVPMAPAATDLLLLLAKPSAPFADTALFPREHKVSDNTCGWAPGPIVAPITEYGLLTGFVDTPMYYSSFGVMPSTFTIECFFKYNDIQGVPYLFVLGIPSSGIGFSYYFSVFLNNTTGRVEFDSTFYYDNTLTTGETNSNTWYHFALTRDGSNWYGSINGSTEVWDITNTSSLDGANLGLNIGGFRASNKLNGSISNFRISNVAKYKTPGRYIVPTVPMLPASTDLLLLLAKPGAPFVDSSSFNRTPTETCEWAPGEPIEV